MFFIIIHILYVISSQISDLYFHLLILNSREYLADADAFELDISQNQIENVFCIFVL